MINRINPYVVHPVYQTANLTKKFPPKQVDKSKKNTIKTGNIDLKKAYNYNYTNPEGKGFSVYV